MIDNTKVYRCECRIKSLEHCFTAASTKPYVVIVDPNRSHLLRDTSWSIQRMHRRSTLLRARANSRTPGVKKGRTLHQHVVRVQRRGRRVWALDRNYLDARRANLKTMSYADVRILTGSRSRPKGMSRGLLK
jgi:hypothetical protein